MLQQKEDKKCLACGKTVKGRSDKKFCDDYCRSNYNNEQKGVVGAVVKNTNNALLKNRKILESILKDGEQTAKANKEKLIEKGFQFKYITHLYQTKNGNTYYHCYEYGYLPLENNWYLIVKKEY